MNGFNQSIFKNLKNKFMPYIDIDASDMYEELDKREKEKVAEWLWSDGYLDNFYSDVLPGSKSYGIDDLKFCESIGTILENRNRLSKEDYETILRIAKNI